MLQFKYHHAKCGSSENHGVYFDTSTEIDIELDGDEKQRPAGTFGSVNPLHHIFNQFNSYYTSSLEQCKYFGEQNGKAPSAP